MKETLSLYNAAPASDDVFRLQKLVKSSVLTGSVQELDTFFGDLKSGVVLVDASFKVIYINQTAKHLNFDTVNNTCKGDLIIDYIKQLLSAIPLLSFYESLINKKAIVIESGFSSTRIKRITLDPILNDGYVLKIVLDELFTVSASNLFRYFPGMPIAYFGFDLVAGKRISLRFLSDNFSEHFPHIDNEKALGTDGYFLSFIHVEDLPDLLLKLQSLKKGKDSLNTEFRFIDAQGEERWYRIIAGRFTEQTEKKFWLAYIEDIHEKKIALLEKKKLIHETLDDERNRMSMELHDGLGQNLVALNLFLSSIQSETQSETVTLCRNLAVESIMQMKFMCYNLAPPELEKGLLYALDVFFAKMNELSLKIEYIYKAKNSPKQFSNDQSYNIFRIVQEFVSNSQKYSGCSKIVCEISTRNNKTTLIIHDNGKGFNQDTINEGFGLKNIYKRAKLIDAKLEFESSEANGTYLILEY
jgi:signal transduction histidine kinase